MLALSFLLLIGLSLMAEGFDHHSASFTVSDLGNGRSRLDWHADVLPETTAKRVAGMMGEGLKVAQGVLGRVPA